MAQVRCKYALIVFNLFCIVEKLNALKLSRPIIIKTGNVVPIEKIIGRSKPKVDSMLKGNNIPKKITPL